MSNDREYHLWELFKSRAEAIDSYVDELIETIQAAESEYENSKKTVEKQAKKIDKLKKELEKVESKMKK